MQLWILPSRNIYPIHISDLITKVGEEVNKTVSFPYPASMESPLQFSKSTFGAVEDINMTQHLPAKHFRFSYTGREVGKLINFPCIRPSESVKNFNEMQHLSDHYFRFFYEGWREVDITTFYVALKKSRNNLAERNLVQYFRFPNFFV